MTDIQNVTRMLSDSLTEVEAYFPDDTVRNVQDLLDHNEPGLALETLCTQLIEYQIVVSSDVNTRLAATENLIGLASSRIK